ncbi:alpha-galactosidase [Paenibacillus sp.]|uniref:alpha-galactosidase n=1 Tax=Paenibacillus sp. TaxID=58172 RepID=UPI0028112F64|nr:alpha-galactosidase [Paenibacillus sp.]
MTETLLHQGQFENGQMFAGPMTVASNDRIAAFLAYEHGSQSTDLYAGFQADSSKTLVLRAVKGSYCHGDPIHAGDGYRTLWMQFGAVEGEVSDLARQYRNFVLRYFSESRSSRKPYIFYNTWNFQERNRYWNRNKYLDSMNLDRILSEIDAAHRMGIEVYVIDTGWFVKTGDWEVNAERFPDGLAQVKEKLDAYGMKLGLWFDPKAVALTSRAYEQYADCEVSWDGIKEEAHPIWETEASVRMCLVSPYGQAFADKLIELSRKLGVVYFKWDAISQYGCNDPGHDHGGPDASPEERGQRFSFELCLKLVDIANRITEAIPEAIIDFDVTEGYRCVGLSFLGAGKYFLINNGPYFPNFDLPRSDEGEFYNYNVFFQPGPARSMLCRTPLRYDNWLPSVLFLTHYFPDDPGPNQNISVASLILGHNGIWGDLLSVSEEGVRRIAQLLGLYKQVREDITSSYPVFYGEAGRNPEVYEKINEANGRGVAVLFANSFGKPFDQARPVKHTYITKHAADVNVWHPSNVSVTFDSAGRAVIEAEFHDVDAAIVFFGVKNGADFST